MSNFIQAGESTVHLTKVQPMQLAEIKSHLQKRPARKFSLDLSPEAQAAMQEAVEEARAKENAGKGKRGSKGNVVFSEKVQVHDEAAPPAPNRGRRASYSDIFELSPLNDIYTMHMCDLHGGMDTEPNGMTTPGRSNGKRRNSLPRTPRRGSLGTVISSLDEVDEVGSANSMTPRTPRNSEDSDDQLF